MPLLAVFDIAACNICVVVGVDGCGGGGGVGVVGIVIFTCYGDDDGVAVGVDMLYCWCLL